MHPNAELIERFYQAFQRHDAEAMAACYAPDAHFSDPVFPDLSNGDPANMWRMLLLRAAELTLVYRDVSADDKTGRAHWTATYPFSKTGRTVVNEIDAAFEFRDGKIVRHRDSFDLWRWAGMALGLKGKLLGWSPLVQNAVRAQAAAGLAAFKAKAGNP